MSTDISYGGAEVPFPAPVKNQGEAPFIQQVQGEQDQPLRPSTPFPLLPVGVQPALASPESGLVTVKSLCSSVTTMKTFHFHT